MTRMRPQERRAAILAAAVSVAEKHGVNSITREQVAEGAGISKAAINYHFKSFEAFRRELMGYAVKHRCFLLVAQGLAVGDEVACSAPDDVKRHARDALLN